MGIPEYLYYIGLSAKKTYALRHQKKLPYRVISIGNITVGGTGKTPATIAVAEEAQRRGFLPVVLTRGYKGSVQGPCFVSRGDGLLLNADEAGDEPVLMAETLKGVPVVKGADRYESGLFALQHLASNRSSPAAQYLFILDDGFQHWKLHRDKDVLLIDSGDPFGRRSLLPLGKLREPLTAMRRADIIVLTKCSVAPGMQRKGLVGLIAEIKKYNRDAPVFTSSHTLVDARLHSGDIISPDRLRGRKVFGFCALGSPSSFGISLSGTGAVITGLRSFRDHHRYSRDDMARVIREAEQSGAEWIATTDKDMIKIRDLDLPGNILIIGIEFTADHGFYETVFAFDESSSKDGG